jgi:ABC-type branched-subunit amino acid transport system ATPase component
MLAVKGLHKSFGGIKAVDGCHFSVRQGSITSLIGPNGAGKSTVFNLVTGLMQPDSGEVILKGEPVVGLPPHEIARMGVARTFQLIRLFPNLTVMDNLLLAKEHLGERLLNVLARPGVVKQEVRANRERCMEFLRLVGLAEKRDSLAKSLSYGQQKLAEIARVLATEADLLLLDEPVAGVTPAMRQQIHRLLLELRREGRTVLLIEHDMNFVMDLSDEVVVLDHGREIAVGPPEAVRSDPRVLEAYLGKELKP